MTTNSRHPRRRRPLIDEALARAFETIEAEPVPERLTHLLDDLTEGKPKRNAPP